MELKIEERFSSPILAVLFEDKKYEGGLGVVEREAIVNSQFPLVVENVAMRRPGMVGENNPSPNPYRFGGVNFWRHGLCGATTLEDRQICSDSEPTRPGAIVT